MKIFNLGFIHDSIKIFRQNALVKKPLVDGFLQIGMSRRRPFGEGSILKEQWCRSDRKIFRIRDYCLPYLSSLSLTGSITNIYVVMRLAFIPARGGSERIPRII
ncbi:hypothetical protein DLD82_17315 [Methanospirillum stamsii]|uniref:Uncharacterized protein n=1 Tax=Methanospirillum stamsii TaxID=1277351 RepID=A0A2V2MNF5_9EURY|nr:hypothetical protein DLD82_17315 [Methanospirillum stamsii]